MSAAAAPKPKKAAAPKKPAEHPKYSEMVTAAIATLKERGGSSRQAILKYVVATYKVGNDVDKVNRFVKAALKKGTEKATYVKVKGSYKIGEKAKKVAKKPKAAKKPAAKKPAAKKPKKAAGEKKTKKIKTPKKKAAAKAKKSPAKKAAKPKTSPAKKAAKKTPKKAAKKTPAKK